jgi:hypothetical protein
MRPRVELRFVQGALAVEVDNISQVKEERRLQTIRIGIDLVFHGKSNCFLGSGPVDAAGVADAVKHEFSGLRGSLAGGGIQHVEGYNEVIGSGLRHWDEARHLFKRGDGIACLTPKLANDLVSCVCANDMGNDGMGLQDIGISKPRLTFSEPLSTVNVAAKAFQEFRG